MFRSATVKLTAIYVGILLVICLLFSGLLYRVLSNELVRNYDSQADFFADKPQFRSLLRDREAQRFLDNQVVRGQRRILLELAYINISLLITGGIASYFFARKTLQPIEEAHLAQTRFTADASHELRTPLATMQTEIEVALRDSKLSLKESKELLSSNLEEIATLRQLTTGLLTLARDTKSTTTTHSTLLKDALEDATNRTKKSAEKNSINVTATIPKKLSLAVDRTHLSEVLVILLDNAIKYSKPKQSVEISAKEKNNTASITIKDSGIGISAENLDHVFDRFYRADNARSQSSKNGHGLGLSIAKQLTDQYGGEIKIASEEGKGTTATLHLPLA